MPRGVQQSDVDRACGELVTQGVRPTAERIRQFLGSGSPNTIGPMLDAWWKTLAERLSAPVCVGYQHNDAFPGSHPLFAGPLGYNGSKAGMELMFPAPSTRQTFPSCPGAL